MDKPPAISQPQTNPSVVSSLESTISTMKTVMETTCSRMAQSLEQSASAMQSMNTCMEEYMKSGIRIRGEVVPGTAEVPLAARFQVQNKGRLPIPKASLRLEVDRAPLDGFLVRFESRAKKRAKTSDGPTQPELEWSEKEVLQDSLAFSTRESHDITADPLEIMVVFERDQKCAKPTFNAFEAHLIVAFASPGTGASLNVSQGIRMSSLDRLWYTWSREDTVVPPVAASTAVDGASLRKLARIPAVDGLVGHLSADRDGEHVFDAHLRNPEKGSDVNTVRAFVVFAQGVNEAAQQQMLDELAALGT